MRKSRVRSPVLIAFNRWFESYLVALFTRLTEPAFGTCPVDEASFGRLVLVRTVQVRRLAARAAIDQRVRFGALIRGAREANGLEWQRLLVSDRQAVSP